MAYVFFALVFLAAVALRTWAGLAMQDMLAEHPELKKALSRSASIC